MSNATGDKKPPFTTKAKPPADMAETVQAPVAPPAKKAAPKKVFKRHDLPPQSPGPTAASRLFFGVGLVMLLGLAGYFIWGREPEAPAAAPKASATASKAPAGEAPVVMTPAERTAYVESNVTVSELEVKPDTKPDGEGGQIPVGGLLQVTGTVMNNGDKPVTPVNLRIDLVGDNDEVLASITDDVTKGRPLAPATPKPFKFTVPDRKNFSGKFLHKLY